MDILFQLTTVFFFAILIVVSLWVAITFAFLIKSRKGYLYSEKRPHVSVIIPAYNEEKNLADCITSILDSGYPTSKMEIIVVDDGSKDRTVEIGKHLGARVLRQNHGGKVNALNLGIWNAKSDFVITVDADTVLERNSINELVGHMEGNIAAVSGVAKIKNKKSIIGSFQNVEYSYLYFMREAFSFLFKTSPGICGPLSCFRKGLLQNIGGFDAKTSAEDFDISMKLRKAGFDVVLARKAVGYTIAPESIRELFRQRVRWAKGVLQAIFLHTDMIGKSARASYLLLVHLFWYVVALFSIPIIAYNVIYWLPFNSQTLFDVLFYFFRWFSFAGIIHMIYMIPYWGINFVYFFGILSGIITCVMMCAGLKRYGEKLSIKNFMGIFFYFPYTMLLNLMLVGSIVFFVVKKGKGTFIK